MQWSSAHGKGLWQRGDTHTITKNESTQKPGRDATYQKCFSLTVMTITQKVLQRKLPARPVVPPSKYSYPKENPEQQRQPTAPPPKKDAGVCSNTLDAIAFRLHFHKPLESERRSPVDVGVDGRGHRKCRISRRKNRIVPRCCISVGIVWISSAERKNRSSTNECPKNVKRVRYAGCWA